MRLGRNLFAAGGLAACLLLDIAYSQSQSPPTQSPVEATPKPITGLKVLSTTIDPKTRSVTVTAQNTTDKTIVGYAIFYRQFRADNQSLGEGGILTDLSDPDNSRRASWISPGQIATIRDGFGAAPDVFSVEARIATVLFEDDTSVGERPPAQVVFTQRSVQGKEAREQAAKEPDGAKKAELERKAAWYEAHSKEATR